MSRARIEMLQWFGLLAAPLAWISQLVLGSFFAEAHCEASQWGTGWSPAVVGLTAAAALVAIAAEAAAARVFVELRTVDEDSPGPSGRRRFFAVGGLVGNALFLVAILTSGITVVAVNGCRPA
ncbi:MAG TPA: hypothetical protein VGM80_08005 [Gaiellaceae bacterium]